MFPLNTKLTVCRWVSSSSCTGCHDNNSNMVPPGSWPWWRIPKAMGGKSLEEDMWCILSSSLVLNCWLREVARVPFTSGELFNQNSIIKWTFEFFEWFVKGKYCLYNFLFFFGRIPYRQSIYALLDWDVDHSLIRIYTPSNNRWVNRWVSVSIVSKK